jgi:putative chitobiose transport system permease protein
MVAPTLTRPTQPPREVSRPRRRSRQGAPGQWWATPYLFLIPALALLAVFFLWPAGDAIRMAFYDYKIVTPARWVGMANFSRMFHDPRFWTALTNSFIFLTFMLPVLVCVPLLLAVLVNIPLRGIKVFRLVYYLPVVTSSVAIGIAWKYVFNLRGALNWVLISLHLIDHPIQWLLDKTWALPAVALVECWSAVGYYMMIYLAGLQSIPSELYEASAVDGAGALQRMRHITIPMMRPYIAVVAVLASLGAVQVFTSVYVMTQGGPQDHTMTLGYYIYDTAFTHFDMGYANAMGIALWVILVVFSLISYRLARGRREVTA